MKTLLIRGLSVFLIGGFLTMNTYGENDVKNSENSIADLLQKADSVFNSREYEKSREFYERAAEKAQIEKNNPGLTESYSMIARTYLILGQKDAGREWITKAREIANNNEPTGWSRYLGVRGRFEWQDEELDMATTTFKEMYAYCVEHELHERAVDAAHMVAITGTHEEQIEWGLKGIRQAEEGDITGWLGPLWNNLGATYEEMEKYPESLEAYLKAREYHWLYGDEKNKLIADWAVGHAYHLNGNLEKAQQWLRPVLSWCERIDETEFWGWSCKELGEIELKQGNNKKALEFLTAAEEKLKASGMPDWDPDGFKKLQNQIETLKQQTKE